MQRFICLLPVMMMQIFALALLNRTALAEVSPCDQVQEGQLPDEKDLSQLTPEVLLTSYLKVNTTNPPGCEGKAARFWKKFFDRYGIESEVIPLPFAQDRANIIARVKGQKSELRPIVLLNHMDVVPADPSRWSSPPFGGEIRKGVIFGRGTFDMKATGTYQALMLVRAKVQNWTMNRDLIFLGTANEEGPFDPDRGVISGAEWMLKNRLELLNNPEFVVTEGGYIPTKLGKPLHWEVSPGEKARIEVTFTVVDSKGTHSDKLFLMARAAVKIMSEFKGKTTVSGSVEDHKVNLNPVERANRSTTHALTILGGVGKGNTIPAAAIADLEVQSGKSSDTGVEKSIRGLLPKGVSIETVKKANDRLVLRLKSFGEAGHASLPPLDGGANLVLAKTMVGLDNAFKQKKLRVRELTLQRLSSVSDDPGEEQAGFAVDFRLLPGELREGVLNQIRQSIKGLPITMKITDDAVISDASPTNTRLFSSIEAANRKFHPNATTRPPVKAPILNSTTDAAYFRQRGMIVYGFEPIMLDPKDEHSHGDDEQISVDAMRFATEVTEYYLREFLDPNSAISPSP